MRVNTTLTDNNSYPFKGCMCTHFDQNGKKNYMKYLFFSSLEHFKVQRIGVQFENFCMGNVVTS